MIAAIHDEGANEMSSWGYDALRRIGGKPPFQTNYRGSFALIGYKGMRDAYVPWIKQGSNERGKGPTVLRASLKCKFLFTLLWNQRKTIETST